MPNPRSYCPTPDRCTAPKRGPCPCQIEARERASAASRAAWADPEVRARYAAAWAGKTIPVPDHLKSYVAKLRRCGIRGAELRKALIEAAS